MKRFATALVLLLLTLTLSIGAQLIFSKKTDELITGLEALLCAVDAGEGEERALEFWRTGDYDFDLVLVTADGRVIITDGLSDRFEVVKDSGYTYETVS